MLGRNFHSFSRIILAQSKKEFLKPTRGFHIESQIGIIGAPVSKGQGKSGVDQAPFFLRQAGLINRLQSLGYTVADYGDLKFETFNNDSPQWNMKNPMTVGNANKKISDSVARVLMSDQKCVTIGGDHSIAIGTLHGSASANPDTCVFWIDAHPDLNPPLASHSGNIHGMVFSFLLRELYDYVPHSSSFDWLKPRLNAKDIVYIGLRDIDQAEKYIINKLGIQAYTMRDVDQLGIDKIMEYALDSVNPGLKRPIHLSFDVDSMDPSVTPSTGTPVLGGLTLREGIYVADELSKTGKLAAVDLVEVNPEVGSNKDRENTVYSAIEVISSCFTDRSTGELPEEYRIPQMAMDQAQQL